MIVKRPARIRATVAVPSDKSISHRSLLFNAIAEGEATVDGLLDSEDVRSTAACLRALGVEVEWPEGATSARVRGRGLHGLDEAENVLDCGNSGTTMRLMAGLLAGHPILSVLTGDASLRSRPMARVIAPLRKMGAHLEARRGDTLAPLVVRGGNLTGIRYDTPVASAQVKSALLLAGLYAEGETSVHEPSQSRDHSERMLAAMGADVRLEGGLLTVKPAVSLRPLAVRVPGDISSAAPWLALGACHPDAEITIQGVNTNPTRTGLLDILEKMGADVQMREERVTGGEPVADLVVRSSKLKGTVVSGGLVPRAIDELPLMALLGAFAEGETVVQDAQELRAKESDRIDAVVRTMSRFGVKVTPREDGFVVEGRVAEMHGGRVDGGGDHRIGMLAGVAGMLSSGETVIENDAVGVSYPRFWEELGQAAGGGVSG